MLSATGISAKWRYYIIHTAINYCAIISVFSKASLFIQQWRYSTIALKWWYCRENYTASRPIPLTKASVYYFYRAYAKCAMRCQIPVQNPHWPRVNSGFWRFFAQPSIIFHKSYPIIVQGTAFQQWVWPTLRTMPSSTTFTYEHLAKGLNTSLKAMGNTCRTNPIPIIILHHHIIG